jgi:methylmalonyl-CoA mutase
MDPRLISEAEFAATDEAGWRALAERALKGASFDTLSSATDDGIRIDPLHERSSRPMPIPRRDITTPWMVIQRIDDPDPARANRQALDDIANGATGFALVFEGAPNAFGYGLPCEAEALAVALRDVPPTRLYLRIDPHSGGRSTAEWLVAHLSGRRADPSRLQVSFGIDPAAIFAGTGRLRMSIEALEASMPQSLSHFFALGVPGVLLEADGRVCHNAGATEAQELGFVLASAISHLRMFQMARQPLVYAAPHIGFALAADQDQFLTIAKFRALRRLWSRAQEACGIDPSATTIHAETSWRMMSRRDPESNILRSTIAVFAAAVGGADSICVLPHTAAHGLPDPFARRVARNTQLVLADESHVGFVSDPCAGAGGIAYLTEALCEAAWKEFQLIESEGGILRSLSAGLYQSRVEAVAAKRLRAFREGERVIVGATLFPPAKARPVETLPAERWTDTAEGVISCDRLEAHRLEEALGASA